MTALLGDAIELMPDAVREGNRARSERLMRECQAELTSDRVELSGGITADGELRLAVVSDSR